MERNDMPPAPVKTPARDLARTTPSAYTSPPSHFVLHNYYDDEGQTLQYCESNASPPSPPYDDAKIGPWDMATGWSLRPPAICSVQIAERCATRQLGLGSSSPFEDVRIFEI